MKIPKIQNSIRCTFPLYACFIAIYITRDFGHFFRNYHWIITFKFHRNITGYLCCWAPQNHKHNYAKYRKSLHPEKVPLRRLKRRFLAKSTFWHFIYLHHNQLEPKTIQISEEITHFAWSGILRQIYNSYCHKCRLPQLPHWKLFSFICINMVSYSLRHPHARNRR